MSLISWMSDTYVRQLRIWDVVLPGSHNSATWQCYVNNDEGWSLANIIFLKLYIMCQKSSIMKQLNKGIRFLDLRVCKPGKTDSEPYCAHNGFLTVSLRAVLKDVANFCEKNPTEVVVLSIRRDVAHVYDAHSLSVVESDFFVALILQRFLGTSLTTDVTIGELADRGQNVVYFFEEKERCLPYYYYHTTSLGESYFEKALKKHWKTCLNKKRHECLNYDSKKSISNFSVSPEVPAQKDRGSRKILKKLVNPGFSFSKTLDEQEEDLSQQDPLWESTTQCHTPLINHQMSRTMNSMKNFVPRNIQCIEDQQVESGTFDETVTHSPLGAPLLAWIKRNVPNFWFDHMESLPSLFFEAADTSALNSAAIESRCSVSTSCDAQDSSKQKRDERSKDKKIPDCRPMSYLEDNYGKNAKKLKHNKKAEGPESSGAPIKYPPHKKKAKKKEKTHSSLHHLPKLIKSKTVPLFQKTQRLNNPLHRSLPNGKNLRKCNSLIFAPYHVKTRRNLERVVMKRYGLPFGREKQNYKKLQAYVRKPYVGENDEKFLKRFRPSKPPPRQKKKKNVRSESKMSQGDNAISEKTRIKKAHRRTEAQCDVSCITLRGEQFPSVSAPDYQSNSPKDLGHFIHYSTGDEPKLGHLSSSSSEPNDLLCIKPQISKKLDSQSTDKPFLIQPSDHQNERLGLTKSYSMLRPRRYRTILSQRNEGKCMRMTRCKKSLALGRLVSRFPTNNHSYIQTMLTPFKSAKTEILKSWSITTDSHPRKLCKKLLNWALVYGTPPPRDPFILRILAGEVTPPSFQSLSASLKTVYFWASRYVSSVLSNHRGLRGYADDTHLLLMSEILTPGVLDRVNGVTHDFTSKKIISRIVYLNYQFARSFLKAN